MREIKFRFYSKHLGKFVVPDDSIFVGALKDPSMNPMQFTGLKDKNGVEIYEGDICKIGRSLYVVEYVDASFVYIGNPEEDSGLRAMGDSSFTSEVIGNIYENPELLTTKDK